MLNRGYDTTLPLVRGNIVIVDLRRLSRVALQRLLESLSFSVIGAGGTLAEALRQAPAEARPDLIIHSFDHEDEAERELPAIVAARERFPGVKSVVLTGCVRTEALVGVMRAGVEAILSRDISADVFWRSLELVLLGERMLPSGLTTLLLQPAEAAPEAQGPQRALLPGLASDQHCGTMLSGREQEILQCLVDGLPNKLIARKLDITEATVKVHIKGLLRKTRMANRTQAAIWALNNRLLGATSGSGDDAAPAPGLAERHLARHEPDSEFDEDGAFGRMDRSRAETSRHGA